MKNKIYTLIFVLIITLFMPSCMTTKTNVGAYKETEGNEYTYAKGKQIWLFWG